MDIHPVLVTQDIHRSISKMKVNIKDKGRAYQPFLPQRKKSYRHIVEITESPGTVGGCVVTPGGRIKPKAGSSSPIRAA